MLLFDFSMSLFVRKTTITIWVPTRSDTNRALQAQKMARCLKFCLCSENKGADQLHKYAPLFSPMQIVCFPMRRLILKRTSKFDIISKFICFLMF